MKLIKDIPQDKYNDVDWILNYLTKNPIIKEDSDVKPLEYFHCFWKGTLSDLHLMCLDSLHKHHSNANIILWSQDSFELQGSFSWIKIKKLLKDKIQIIQVNKNHFKEANVESLFSQYLMLTTNKQNIMKYNHDLAYASDIIRFIVLHLYGGLWFDMDVLFLKSFDSIKIKRYTSQWGTDMCGNAAIMRLEKGHDLIEKILNKFEKPFYPTTTFKVENELDLTMIPSTFFDILWRPEEQIPSHIQFNDLNDFFNIKELNLPKEIYAYHWHNRWKNNVPNFYK